MVRTMYAHSCRRLFYVYSSRPTYQYRTLSSEKFATDAYAIPIRPTWSVHKLLSSYPKPTLSSPTLTRLHELSALLPPTQGTPRHETLRQDMEDLIKLVEAVKLVDTTNVQPRHQHKNSEKNPVQHNITIPQETSGDILLQHAARSSKGFYVVDTDRRR